MKNLSARLAWPLAVLAILAMAGTPAFGQVGAATTLSGVVTDDQGGVIPGANVVAKNNATAFTADGTTDGTGRFTLPGVSPGIYTVTVSLLGFKTAVLPDIQVLSGTPAQIKVTLKVGTLEETVVVTGATDMVQTQTASVQTTLQVKQLQALPLVTHTALDSLLALPGVATPYGQTSRNSRLDGLGGASINITLDGLNVQDNRSKSDGFFMYIRPMLDSVEEITVTTSASEAAVSGEGAANIRMTTRSGSNRFSGSVYSTWRNQAGLGEDDIAARTEKQAWYWRLNTPYYFNKQDFPKTPAGDWYFNDARVETPGFRVGGPIMKDKLFYFFNLERFVWPAQVSRYRFLMNPAAQRGDFTYTGNDKLPHTVNLLAIAAKYNVPGNTLDPNIQKLLTDIRDSTGGITESWDQNNERFAYIPAADGTRLFPTVRMDYNLSPAHRVSGTYRYNQFRGSPDILNAGETRWPGFPNLAAQNSDRWMIQGSYRGTFGKNIVNETNAGYVDAYGKGTGFGGNITAADFNCSGPGCQSVNGEGFTYGFPTIGTNGLTGATTRTNYLIDVAPRLDIDNTVTWLKNKHTISFGGAYARTFWRISSQTFPKPVGFGIPSSRYSNGTYYDPAYPVINATNTVDFPGGLPTANYEGWARNLYAFLTGRVNNVGGNMVLGEDGQYQYQGELRNKSYRDNIGFFVSDSWRVKPNLTLTGGLRYEVQFPGVGVGNYATPQDWTQIYGITGAGGGESGSGNLYVMPRVQTGTAPVLVKYDQGTTPSYTTDWNNLAPSVGMAWRPNLESAWYTKILSRDPVFRAGYSMNFTKYGIELFNAMRTNPGESRSATRTETSGTPVLGNDGWPVLLSQTSRLYGSLATPEGSTPVFPSKPAINESIRAWDPDWQLPYVHQYSFGFQRELGKSMGLEIRYTGNTTVGGWQTWNMLTTDNWPLLENGWFNEFQLAQKNLHANIVNGKGTTFAYMGPGTGTFPLPIHMAYLKGIPLTDSRNQDQAQYTSVTQFSNSTWYNRYGLYNPNVTGSLGTTSSGLLYGLGTGTNYDANRIAAGLPINFFQPNPDLREGSAFLDRGTGNTRYNALTFDLRRRMTAGLLLQGSYTYSFARQTYSQNSLREAWYYIPAAGAPVQNLKFNWVGELPFGQGKKWGSGSGRWMNYLIGGWEVDGVVRFQSGNRYNYGGTKFVNMTTDEVQDMFKFYHRADENGVDRIYMWPEDVIANSIIAFNNRSATTASGYTVPLDPNARYFAPASSPECVQYVVQKDMYCAGTEETRFINGPWFFRTDLSIIKRFNIYKNVRLEARMELFNLFDTVNLIPNTTTSASSVSGWRVTSAATDFNASQDPGGRITQFGLRVTW